MMNVGLIDVDSHNFPSLPIMKLSAWHKAQGDHVEWYPMIYDKEHADPIYRKLQRWCNNWIFWKVPTFEEYKRRST